MPAAKSPSDNADRILLQTALRVMSGLMMDMQAMHGLSQSDKVSLGNDWNTLRQRTCYEGVPFVTKVLPSLGKALDAALISGTAFVTPVAFAREDGYATPVFLQSLWRQIFTRDGLLRDDASVTAIADIRQVAYVFYKYELPMDEGQVPGLVAKWLDVDRELKELAVMPPAVKVILDKARSLCHELLGGLDLSEIVPRHSKGAVSSGEHNCEKHFFRSYDDKSSAWKSYSRSYLFANERQFSTSIARGRKIRRKGRSVSSLLFVPKDSRGPRAICMESLTMQFMQQGVKAKLYDWLERHPLSKGRINFADQEINRRLALQGSMMGGTAISTLDMKEASDRIALWLVKYLLPGNCQAILNLRSDQTRLPVMVEGKKVATLNKYAPMGSALCFPVEAIVHWSVAVATLALVYKRHIKDVAARVYVYGDDIILDGLAPTPLFKMFAFLGMKFNTDKCCCQGNFRESCGVDAFKGEVISPVKVKTPAPVSSKDVAGVVAYVKYCNLAFDRGYYHMSLALQDIAETIIGDLPIGPPACDVLCLEQSRQQGLCYGSYDRKIVMRDHATAYCDLVYASDLLTKVVKSVEQPTQYAAWKGITFAYKAIAAVPVNESPGIVETYSGESEDARYLACLLAMARRNDVSDDETRFQKQDEMRLVYKYSSLLVSQGRPVLR